MKRGDYNSGDKKQGNMQWFLLGLIVGAGGYYAYETYMKPKAPPTTTPTGGRPMPIEERPSITTFADTSGGGCGCKGSGVTIITAGNVAGIRERL